MVLYRDMRTYGFREAAYREAREKGHSVRPLRAGAAAATGRSTAACDCGCASRRWAATCSLTPDLVVLAAPMIAARRPAGAFRAAARAAERRRLLPRSPHEAAPGGFRQRRAVPLRHGPRAEVPQRDDLPGQRRGRPGGVDPLPEEDAGQRPDRLGRSGQVHLLHDLRARLPVHGPAHQRVQQGRGAGRGLHGLRQLHGRMPGQGDHAAALRGRPDPGRHRRPAGQRIAKDRRWSRLYPEQVGVAPPRWHKS